jgi:hypothetical protein
MAMDYSGGLIHWLESLEKYQKKRINTGRNLSNNNKFWEKYSEKVIRNHFRRAGASMALPYNRVKMITKIRNVYQNAAAIINAQRQMRENTARRRAQQRANERLRREINARPPATIRRANVPSRNVQFGKRTNGRGPNVVVLSP